MNTRRVLATPFVLAGLTGLPSAAQAAKSLSPLAESGVGDGAAQRDALIARIVDKWADLGAELYRIDINQWRAEMDPLFAKASQAALEQAAEAKTYIAMDNALLGVNGAIAPMALGDTATDLVYVPISPCRIFDTRVAGGVINATTTRNFGVSTETSYTFQGGSATDCNGAGSAGSFAAAAIIFTTVNPTNIGYITAFPLNTAQPVSATMAYNANTLASNQAIVKLDQTGAADELTVYSSAQTHLVGDLVGYFINPQPANLECTQTSVSSFTIAAGASAFFNNPLCPSGYTTTAPYCYSGDAGVYSQGSGHNSNTAGLATFCAWTNSTGASKTVYGGSVCCRVPGR